MPVYERSIPFHPLHRSTLPPAAAPQIGDERAWRDPDDVCGVILAGSSAWGETHFARLLRSPTVPIAGTPIIHHAVDWLGVGGVRQATICSNGWTAAIRESVGDGTGAGMSIGYFEDHEPRGPGGCAHDAMRRSRAATFVVVEGCMIPLLDLAALLSAHRLSGAAATLVVEVERRSRHGGPSLPPAGGIYVFERRALEAIPARGHHDLRESVVERLRDAGERVLTYEVHGIAPRVVDEESYASVSRWLIPRVVERPQLLPRYSRRGSALVHPLAWVSSSARLLGPVIVGPGSRIDDHAVVVGPVSIGARVRIGAHASVARSVLWDECSIGIGACIDDALLAEGAQVERSEQVLGETRAPRRDGSRRRVSWISPAPSAASDSCEWVGA